MKERSQAEHGDENIRIRPFRQWALARLVYTAIFSGLLCVGIYATPTSWLPYMVSPILLAWFCLGPGTGSKSRPQGGRLGAKAFLVDVLLMVFGVGAVGWTSYTLWPIDSMQMMNGEHLLIGLVEFFVVCILGVGVEAMVECWIFHDEQPTTTAQ